MRAGRCTEGFAETVRTLGPEGPDCATAPALASVRSPFELAGGTLPVVELLMIGLAVAGLVHAVLRYRRLRDPVNLAVWCASVVYVLVLEPPLYFPDAFGLQDQLGLIFVHNLFAVNFLWDRLPLYIVAIYPAQLYLSFAIVQRTGVLARRSPVLAAAAVALVYHAFYEIFDHLGPQLRWWAWNPDAPSNAVMVDSVPLSSAAVFAAASPFGLTLLALLLVGRRAQAGPVPRASLALRTLLVGVLAPVAMTVLALPYGVFSQPGHENRTGQAAGLWLILAAVAVGGAVAFRRTWREGPGPAERGYLAAFGPLGGAVYLGVFGVLWVRALPDLLGATGGVTVEGTPTGNLPYVLVCTVVAVAVTVLAARGGAAGDSRSEVSDEGDGRLGPVREQRGLRDAGARDLRGR